MAISYIAAGLNHFRNAKFYLKIIPPSLPFPKWVNWISGAAEVILGILLFFPNYSSLAAWGIIALLIAVFPANIYHFTSNSLCSLSNYLVMVSLKHYNRLGL